jgi:hypothetical protein
LQRLAAQGVSEKGFSPEIGYLQGAEWKRMGISIRGKQRRNRIWRLKGKIKEFIGAKILAVNILGCCESERSKDADQ